MWYETTSILAVQVAISKCLHLKSSASIASMAVSLRLVHRFTQSYFTQGLTSMNNKVVAKSFECKQCHLVPLSTSSLPISGGETCPAAVTAARFTRGRVLQSEQNQPPHHSLSVVSYIKVDTQSLKDPFACFQPYSLCICHSTVWHAYIYFYACQHSPYPRRWAQNPTLDDAVTGAWAAAPKATMVVLLVSKAIYFVYSSCFIQCYIPLWFSLWAVMSYGAYVILLLFLLFDTV